MRILVLSHDFSGASLCHRLAREGHEVAVSVAGGDRLEEDRPCCQRVLADYGIPALPTAHFAKAADAIAHVRAHPGPWVIKQNGHAESIVCYAGRRDDGADVVDLLAHYARRYGDRGNSVLRRRCQRVEIGVGRHFNGRRWVGPMELNIEHKKLCAGDVGPKTHEMGTLMWCEADEARPLFRATPAKREPYLRQADFRGDVDINCIVNAEGAFPYHGPGDRADLSPRGLKIHFRRPQTEEDWRHLHPEEVSRRPDGGGGGKYLVAGDGGYVMHVSGFGPSVEAAHRRAARYAWALLLARISE